MKAAFDDFALEWPHQFDSFGSERENFECDAHMLILSGLDGDSLWTGRREGRSMR